MHACGGSRSSVVRPSARSARFGEVKLLAVVRLLLMGFVMELDATNKILCVRVTGYVDNEIMRDIYAAVAGYVADHGPCRAITDLSGVTKGDVSPSAIWSLARQTPAIPKGYMRVIVAPDDSRYGMVRIFQILSELTRPDIQVVRTLDEAYRLLQVESPEFRPAA
jgi:hypothetical protein